VAFCGSKGGATGGTTGLPSEPAANMSIDHENLFEDAPA